MSIIEIKTGRIDTPRLGVGYKVTSVIKWLSGYTMGIYFMHWIVGRCMNAVWLRYFGVEKTLLETFVIFIACLIICVIIDLIPLKATKMLVR